ncbi:uncharacterized protein BJ212DRAFT_1298654 [Suillus subaureus]|uniref:Uncharacterized protein n=1 Tax=Suillus subaureus TaxID=48587 RepID=A0A9P7EE97_9AGAM|nr:uncharacterized protein BJ212DRAFT_1298654 [Suillus subaureus]KAG1818575.1 hypothetical protein BJ212DRAFT_1298654 [Suillus subaureus]
MMGKKVGHCNNNLPRLRSKQLEESDDDDIIILNDEDVEFLQDDRAIGKDCEIFIVDHDINQSTDEDTHMHNQRPRKVMQRCCSGGTTEVSRITHNVPPEVKPHHKVNPRTSYHTCVPPGHTEGTTEPISDDSMVQVSGTIQGGAPYGPTNEETKTWFEKWMQQD